MNVEFAARDIELTDEIREYFNKRIHKIERFLDEPVEVHAVFSEQKHLRRAEVHVTHAHGFLQAAEEDEMLLDAMQRTIHKLEKQARRGIKKFQDQRRKADREMAHLDEWPLEVVETGFRPSGEPQVIRSPNFQVKPMTVEDAALQLEASRNGFVVFRDADKQQIQVLYRRRDGNYGLIAPET